MCIYLHRCFLCLYILRFVYVCVFLCFTRGILKECVWLCTCVCVMGTQQVSLCDQACAGALYGFPATVFCCTVWILKHNFKMIMHGCMCVCERETEKVWPCVYTLLCENLILQVCVCVHSGLIICSIQTALLKDTLSTHTRKKKKQLFLKANSGCNRSVGLQLFCILKFQATRICSHVCLTTTAWPWQCF